MSLSEAIAMVEAAGYRVSRPRPAAVRSTGRGLNAIGKPYSPQFDPRYRMKYRTPPIKGGGSIGRGVTPEQWVEMCKVAAEEWAKFMAGGAT